MYLNTLLGVPRESRGIKVKQRRTSVVQDWGFSFMGSLTTTKSRTTVWALEHGGKTCLFPKRSLLQ